MEPGERHRIDDDVESVVGFLQFVVRERQPTAFLNPAVEYERFGGGMRKSPGFAVLIGEGFGFHNARVRIGGY